MTTPADTQTSPEEQVEETSLSGFLQHAGPQCPVILDPVSGGRTQIAGATGALQDGDPVTVLYSRVKRSTSIPDPGPQDSTFTAIIDSFESETAWYVVRNRDTGWALGAYYPTPWNPGMAGISPVLDPLPYSQAWQFEKTDSGLLVTNSAGGLWLSLGSDGGVAIGGYTPKPAQRQWSVEWASTEGFWIQHSSGVVLQAPEDPAPGDHVTTAPLDKTQPDIQIWTVEAADPTVWADRQAPDDDLEKPPAGFKRSPVDR